MLALIYGNWLWFNIPQQTISIYFKVSFYKLSMQWYLTPQWLNHANRTANNQGWHCKNNNADIQHTFWTYPKINTLWNNTIKEIDISGYILQIDSQVILFGYITELILIDDKEMVISLLIVAHITICS